MKIEFNGMIKEAIFLGHEGEYIPNDINIAYGIDTNFLYGCGISIVSILTQNPDKKFNFHVFIDDSMNHQNIERFREICLTYNTKITLYYIDAKNLNKLPTTKNWTHAIYFRFIIAEYFKNKINYLLYLDADIICHNKINELVSLTLSEEVAAVVAERDEKWWINRANSLDTPAISEGYFNSGVMYINLLNWQKQQITEKSIDLLMDENLAVKLSYPDQDVLNILLMGKVIYLQGIFNTQFSLNYELKDNFVYPVNENTVFIHYVGPTKPWHEWASYSSAEPFHRARRVSPWSQVPLMVPSNSNYLRYCAKHQINQRKYMKGFISYIQYFISKIK
ncbi:glycosyltransferase [Providencia huaxiensis]|uniref:Lipopolysaccharide 1,3-galactosyltransferase n=1 Tax=Providencia huaxiensis TaxID=2027290 RepID=A0ABU2J2K8_9GAMM|nr:MULTISPECIES: glycosyltransferase [Providencia]MDT0135561.1 lipopolysaccharide 1,3-galactosyltransferase [Providencia huaxiensis]MDT1981966.1 lipopolysaccharide 1,3-galactosyltransferase [Providencia huaxiensis]